MMRNLTAAFLILWGFAPALIADDRPNVVLILSDDQAWTDYSFMGHPHIDTPRLDQLAAQSVVFRRGYVPTSLCRPSLMTIITGRYASDHGVTGNDPSPAVAPTGSPEDDRRRAELIAKIDGLTTVAGALSDAGYATFQTGKWWEGTPQRGGFEAGMTRGFPKPGGRHGDDGLKIGRDTMQPVDDFIARSAAAGKPFFLWYAPFLPHAPHDPSPKLIAKYKAMGLSDPVARYYANCERFDETCGEVLDRLDDAGVADNTLVVYLTDNGWIQSEKRNRFAARSKQTPYEGGVRTPIMYRWPAKFPPAERTELATSLDIMPTMLAAAGVEAPTDLPGLNLVPALSTGTPIDRDVIFGEGFSHDIIDLDDSSETLMYRWVISGDWKLIRHYGGVVNRYEWVHPADTPDVQLYDLAADPAETHDLADEKPEVVARLDELLRTDGPTVKP